MAYLMKKILKHVALIGFLGSLYGCFDRCEEMRKLKLHETEKLAIPYSLNQKSRFVHLQYNDTFWMICDADQFYFDKLFRPNSEGRCEDGYQVERRIVNLKSKYMTIHFNVGMDWDDISYWNYNSKFSFWIDGDKSQSSFPFSINYYDSLTFPGMVYSDSGIVHGVLFNKVYTFSFYHKNQNAVLFYTFKDGLVAIKGISNFNIVKVD